MFDGEHKQNAKKHCFSGRSHWRATQCGKASSSPVDTRCCSGKTQKLLFYNDSSHGFDAARQELIAFLDLL